MIKDDETQIRFAALIGGVAEVFGEKLSPPRIEAYFDALSDYQIEHVEQACKRAMRECRFFPKPVELRELLEGAPEDQAREAWRVALEAMRVGGAYNSIWFDDAAIVDAIEKTFGSWPRACAEMRELKAEMQKSREKDFATNYRIARRFERRQQKHYLEGQHEQNNRSTVGNFKRGALPQTQPVTIATSQRVACVPMKVNEQTGQIEREVLELLTDGRSALVLIESATRERKMIAEPEGETVTLDEAIKSERSKAVRAGLQKLRDELSGGKIVKRLPRESERHSFHGSRFDFEALGMNRNEDEATR